MEVVGSGLSQKAIGGAEEHKDIFITTHPNRPVSGFDACRVHLQNRLS
jgi:hypothetical protein